MDMSNLITTSSVLLTDLHGSSMVELAAEIAWKSPRITTAMTAKIARNQTDLRIHDVFRVVDSTTGAPPAPSAICPTLCAPTQVMMPFWFPKLTEPFER